MRFIYLVRRSHSRTHPPVLFKALYTNTHLAKWSLQEYHRQTRHAQAPTTVLRPASPNALASYCTTFQSGEAERSKGAHAPYVSTRHVKVASIRHEPASILQAILQHAIAHTHGHKIWTGLCSKQPPRRATCDLYYGVLFIKSHQSLMNY